MPSSLTNLYRYGREINTHDLIKILAIILMVIDHVGEYLYQDNIACRLIGRAAAPLFFFLIGYVNKLRVSTRLFIYGFILSLLEVTFNQHFWINILITFVVIEMILQQFPPDKMATWRRGCGFIGAVGLSILLYPYIEYGLLGLLFAYSARLVALEDKQATFWLTSTLFIYYLWETYYFRFTNHLWALNVFAGMSLLLFFMMRYYRYSSCKTPPLLTFPALLLSRYSLDIYFFHLLLLQSIFFIKRF